jgi:phenylacetate-CoA ligase
MSLTHQLFLQSLRELGDTAQNKFDTHRMPLIASLLDHAWGTVPAYRRRIGVHVADASFDLARWCDLPVLRRDEAIALGAALEARVLPPEANEVEDVPSPASPVRRRSRLAAIATACAREWMLERNGIDLAASLAVLHSDHAGAPPRGVGWSITFTDNKWFAGDHHAEPEAQLAWLKDSGATLLRTEAATAERLAAASRGPRLGIEALIIADAGLTPGRRAAIEAAIGVPVVHIIEEPALGIIAASDPRGGYLVPAATAVVEVVDAEGRPAASGEPGELVLTPLYEYAMPLLRYATGIAAIAAPGPPTLIGLRKLDRAGGVSA